MTGTQSTAANPGTEPVRSNLTVMRAVAKGREGPAVEVDCGERVVHSDSAQQGIPIDDVEIDLATEKRHARPDRSR